MSDRVLKRIGQYCAQPDFQPDIIGRVSLAAKSLCMWVRAMETYGTVYRVVEPKKQRLNNAMATLAEKQAILAEAKAKLKEVGPHNPSPLYHNLLIFAEPLSYLAVPINLLILVLGVLELESIMINAQGVKRLGIRQQTILNT